MRNVVLYLLLALLVLGCEKESGLTSKIELEDLYAIKDDPSDPVKHRVYELYSKYGIPVYFNDTIGKIFVKKDVTGKDVYRYEKLDLSWGFTSYSQLKYSYEYMTDPDEQLTALGIIEEYLELAAKPLHPFNFFVTKSAKTIDIKDEEKIYKEGEYKIHFRTVLMTGDWTESQITSLPNEMMREMVKNKITNYKDLLAAFNSVSDRVWYGKSWAKLDPHWYDYVETTDKPSYYFSPSALSDTWYAINEFEPEELEEFRAALRLAMGQFGFVAGGQSSLYTPGDNEKDLVSYISEMLNRSRDEFIELWGESPLVMAKYEILYHIVADELGVKL